jgi:hypothetical protein
VVVDKTIFSFSPRLRAPGEHRPGPLVGFQGNAMLGSLAADFWVGSLASLIWMIVEGRRLQMARIWIYFVLTFVIAWAFALPLFLYMRERRLAR